MMVDRDYQDAFLKVWRTIAARFRGRAGIYGYDLVNEPNQSKKAVVDYWNIQRLAAEEIRKIDPVTPIIVESNGMDSPRTFAYLSPLKMDNVIYEVHMYEPGDYTHQGVRGEKDFARLEYPKGARNRDYLVKSLAAVRKFEQKHKAKIYVGEFSVAGWALGADRYLDDCIAIFREYGWDWTYHAFREWPGWSVEHEPVKYGVADDCFKPSPDNPRKRALLRGIRGGKDGARQGNVGDVLRVKEENGERTLSLEAYRDKLRGAWIGQIAGVCFGAPTEFRWGDSIVPRESLPEWRPEKINEAFGQDDLYVEMTFLRTLEQHGLDVSIRQAGLDFANSEYRLWCANREGRMNMRKGIAPPASSHPKFNRCPNDIDYQIEADYAGIISPGCPQEVIRLGNVFGRLMNFGDGVWAGQFVGAMYAEAFFTEDVERILDAGLAAIPEASDYAKMVRDVRAWRREFPNDWTKAWQKVFANYSKRRNPNLKDANGDIDVRLNGAAVVLGLVYGGGDIDRSIEISTRCGWDSDCNPSTVAGVLGCAKGFARLDAKYTAKIDNARKFDFTAYDLPGLYAVCEKLARQVVVRSGGRIEKDGSGRESFVVPDRRPVADAFVPSWQAPDMERLRFTEAEMAQIKHPVRLPDAASVDDPDPTVRVQKTLDALFPGWKTSPNAPDMQPGLREVVDSTKEQVVGCLLTHPPKPGQAVTLSRRLKVPEGDPRLRFDVANWQYGDFRLGIRVDGLTVLSTTVGKPDKRDWRVHFVDFDFSLEPWAGKEVTLELVNEPTGWEYEAAIWHDIRITANNGTL